MIAIIDYGVGNLFSLQSSFRALNIETVVSGEPEVLLAADKLILPGVGAFRDAADKLFSSGLADIILKKASDGTHLLGICLGMQLLFEKSYEYGEHRGLSLLKGEVKAIADTIPSGLKIPHIGWNYLTYPSGSSCHPLFADLPHHPYVYFVHSYHAVGCEDSLIASTDYGASLTAAVAKNNVMGCQFHPEKSGDIGLSILRAFCSM